MATAAAAAVAKARRDVISHFLSRHAVTPDSAVPYEPGRRLRSRQFAKLKDRGVILAGTRPGYHYVDVAAWDAERRSIRRRIAIGVVAGATIAAIAAALA